jgi:hypothetical protein
MHLHLDACVCDHEGRWEEKKIKLNDRCCSMYIVLAWFLWLLPPSGDLEERECGSEAVETGGSARVRAVLGDIFCVLLSVLVAVVGAVER